MFSPIFAGLALGMSVVLSGCSSNFEVPLRDTTKFTQQGYATIQHSGFSETGMYGSDSTRFTVYQVDGPGNPPPLSSSPGLFVLRPGINTVKVRVNEIGVTATGNPKRKATRTGTFQRNASGCIVFLAAPGTAYTLNGTIDGDRAKIWISETYSLKQVTPEVELLWNEEDRQKTESPPSLSPP